MIDGTLFDKLVRVLKMSGGPLRSPDVQEEVARLMRKNDQPFGGIQVRDHSLCETAPIRLISP
jgi:hypothetical protein